MREAMEFYEKNVNHEKAKLKQALKNCFDFEVKFVSLLEEDSTEGEPQKTEEND
jgi:hypothetical protein